jgi:adenosylcobinamide-GDP ribazoletransferase
MNGQWRQWKTAPRFMPLLGAAVGAVGGAVYWLAALIWPASIAVILSMLATALLFVGTGSGTGLDTRSGAAPALQGAARSSPGLVFFVLVKFNALMALSAASLPFPLPANLTLGVIMIAGQAASRALVVSVAKSASHADLGIALAIGFAPAALIGIPGLIGLATATVMRLAFVTWSRRRRPLVAHAQLDALQQTTEICFYLGALASWPYI